MVFITLFSRNRKIPWWLVLACLLAAAPAARGEGIQVRAAELATAEDSYSLNADFDISLNPTLEDALNKGVALYFVAEFELMRSRWYWFDETLSKERISFKLSYNALTRQYRLSVGSLYQNFPSLDEALRVLSRLRNRPVLEKNQIRKDEIYSAALRMRLDVSLLPKPFQLNALASREWSLSSDWYRWTIAS